MVQSVDGKTLAGMLIHASACLNAEKQKINELNVFPVPDGDTGTNMSLTISTAAAELRQKKPTTVEKAAAVCASAMLRGARGKLRGHPFPDLPGLFQSHEGQDRDERHRPGRRAERRGHCRL